MLSKKMCALKSELEKKGLIEPISDTATDYQGDSISIVTDDVIITIVDSYDEDGFIVANIDDGYYTLKEDKESTLDYIDTLVSYA